MVDRDRRPYPSEADLDRLQAGFNSVLSSGFVPSGHYVEALLAHGNYYGAAREAQRQIENQRIKLGLPSHETVFPTSSGYTPSVSEQHQTNPSGLTDIHPAEHHVGSLGTSPSLPSALRTHSGPGDIHGAGYHTGAPGPKLPR